MTEAVEKVWEKQESGLFLQHGKPGSFHLFWSATLKVTCKNIPKKKQGKKFSVTNIVIGELAWVNTKNERKPHKISA